MRFLQPVFHGPAVLCSANRKTVFIKRLTALKIFCFNFYSTTLNPKSITYSTATFSARLLPEPSSPLQTAGKFHT